MRRALLASGLVLVFFLGGCASSTSTSTNDSATTTSHPPHGPVDAPTGITFSTPVILGAQLNGVEPGIAVGADGTLYATTPLAMWRSDDNGTTWTDLGGAECPAGAPLPTCPGLETSRAPAGMEGGGDADVWVTPNGRVHWLGLGGTTGPIPYQYSDDEGVTWSPAFDVSLGKGADREWITGRADGTLFAAWRDQTMIRSARSTDGGATWSAPRDIAPDTRQGGISVDPSSHLLALAHDLGGTVSVATSTDEGENWTSVVVAQNPVQGQVFPVSAFDAAGNLYVAYAADLSGTLPDVSGYQRPLEHPNVYLQVSHDDGKTWSKAVQVNAAGTTAWFPWIAAGAEGKIVITYYQNDKGLPRYAADAVNVVAAIALDGDLAAPHFALTTVTPQPVHNGSECRETPPCTRSFLDFFEVAIAPDGHPVTVFAKDLYPVPRVEVAFSRMTAGPNLLE